MDTFVAVEQEPMNTCVDVESTQTRAQEEGLPTDIQYSNQKILRTQGVSIPSLPPEMSIVEMMADGACLFNSVSYAISGEQTLAYMYRIKALKYITDNAKEFQEDIQNMTGKSVQEYVKYMTIDHAFGDDIMIIAMCLDFNASITVFIQGRTTIESVTYSPSNPIGGQVTHEVKIYLKLGDRHSCPHYNCIVESLSDNVIGSPVVTEQPSTSKPGNSTKKRKSTTAQSDSIKKPKSNSTIPKDTPAPITTPKPDSVKKQKPKEKKKKSPMYSWFSWLSFSKMPRPAQKTVSRQGMGQG